MRRTTSIWVSMAALGSLLGGCLEPAAEGTAEGTAAAVPITDRQLVAELSLSETHVVRFWKDGDGSVSVDESAAIGESPVLRMQVETLAGLYLALVPGATLDEVPPALVAADAAAAARPDEPSSAADRAGQGTSYKSDDFFGDNWGAQWFLDNFCWGGEDNWCHTNLPGFTSNHRGDDWYEVCVMAGDFEIGNRMTVGRHWRITPILGVIQLGEGWNWETIDIAPRTIECRAFSTSGIYTGRYKSQGSDATGHLHVAVNFTD